MLFIINFIYILIEAFYNSIAEDQRKVAASKHFHCGLVLFDLDCENSDMPTAKQTELMYPCTYVLIVQHPKCVTCLKTDGMIQCPWINPAVM